MALGDLGHDAKRCGREVLHGRFPATADEAAPFRAKPLRQRRSIRGWRGARVLEMERWRNFAGGAGVGCEATGPIEKGSVSIGIREFLAPESYEGDLLTGVSSRFHGSGGPSSLNRDDTVLRRAGSRASPMRPARLSSTAPYPSISSFLNPPI